MDGKATITISELWNCVRSIRKTNCKQNNAIVKKILIDFYLFSNQLVLNIPIYSTLKFSPTYFYQLQFTAFDMGKTRHSYLMLLSQKACKNYRLYLVIMQCEDFILKKENISLNAKLKFKAPTYHHEQESRILQQISK